MNAYFLARALHLVGAVLFFVTLGVEWVALRAVRRARTTAELRTALVDFGLTRRVGPIAALLTLGAGIYLATTVWSWVPGWIHTGISLFFIYWGVGGIVSGRGVRKLGLALTHAGEELPPEVRALQQAPGLLVSFAARVGLLFTMLLIMVLKPGPGLQAGMLATSLLGAVVVWRRAR